MKFTQIAADAFKKLQLNAGVLLTDFDPEDGALDKTKIIGATGGGISFSITPTYKDFGDGIDNLPANTKELKRIESFEIKMSGTAKTVDTTFAKMLIAAADVEGNKVTPRDALDLEDFSDIWWVGDYSDVTDGDGAGFIAVKMIDALSTGGFQIKSNDKDKGDFSFEFTAHYSLSDITKVPCELYIKSGSEADATLSVLTIGSLTLEPEFDSDVYEYVCSTSNSTNAVTATATKASDGATVAILVNGNSLTSGGSATWSTGENTVVIKVTNDSVVKTYTVTVIKS